MALTRSLTVVISVAVMTVFASNLPAAPLTFSPSKMTAINTRAPVEGSRLAELIKQAGPKWSAIHRDEPPARTVSQSKKIALASAIKKMVETPSLKKISEEEKNVPAKIMPSSEAAQNAPPALIDPPEDAMQPRIKVVEGDLSKGEFFILDDDARPDAPLAVAANETQEKLAAAKAAAIAQTVMASSGEGKTWVQRLFTDHVTKPLFLAKAEDMLHELVASIQPARNELTPQQKIKLQRMNDESPRILANRTLRSASGEQDLPQGEVALKMFAAKREAQRLEAPKMVEKREDVPDLQEIRFKRFTPSSPKAILSAAMDSKKWKVTMKRVSLKQSLLQEEGRHDNQLLKRSVKAPHEKIAKRVAIVHPAIAKQAASKWKPSQKNKKPIVRSAKQPRFKVKEYTKVVGYRMSRPSAKPMSKKPGRIRFVIRPYQPNVEFTVKRYQKAKPVRLEKQFVSKASGDQVKKYQKKKTLKKTLKKTPKKIPKKKVILTKPHPYQSSR